MNAHKPLPREICERIKSAVEGSKMTIGEVPHRVEMKPKVCATRPLKLRSECSAEKILAPIRINSLTVKLCGQACGQGPA